MLAAAVAVPAAWAQAASPNATTTTVGDAGGPPTATELDHFVRATAKMHGIVVDAHKKILATDDVDERDRLKRDVESQVEAVVKKYDLTELRYQQIAVAVQNDAATRRKAQAIAQRIGPQ